MNTDFEPFSVARLAKMATRVIANWRKSAKRQQASKPNRNNSTDTATSTEPSRSQSPGAEQTYKTINAIGLPICFPFEAYGIQRVMLNKVTSTLMNKEHSLIESPTGTGKTLVLLCSSLAWQRKSKSLNQPFISTRLRKQVAEERRQILMRKPCTCGRRPMRTELDRLKEAAEGSKKSKACLDSADNPKKAQHFQQEDEISACKRIKTEPSNEILKTSPYFKKENQPNCITIDDEDSDHVEIIEDDCKKSNSIKQFDEQDCIKAQQISDKPLCRSCAAIEAENEFSQVLGEDSLDGENFISSKIKTKIPRIYYGTRTHKQITQVIRELNKTPYKNDLNMCILSSRERTCINQEVKDSANRNDLCQELLKNKQSSDKNKANECCPFYKDSATTADTFAGINNEFKHKAWDIEDAAAYGREIETCPYYGVRSLQDQADITFCPYNYLLDPTIRRTLNINLSNAIIIFDEAHNIEDICRDSASFVIDTRQIDDILESIQVVSNHYIQGSVVMDAYQFFRDKLLNLKAYLKNSTFSKDTSESGNFLEKNILTQDGMINDLTSIGLGPDCLNQVKENLRALRGEDESDDGSSSKKGDAQPALSFSQMQSITQLSITLEFMYISNCKYINDFRAVVTKSLERETNRFTQRANNRGPPPDKHLWRFSLLCMNSGIAFEKIHSWAWSVIVASGTLSPIESLKSELGCTFSQIFEGAHVIPPERIFASILSSGPSKTSLNCAFTNSLSMKFQDEVYAILRDVCTTVPNGILCFFPSYDRMENFHRRWVQIGFKKDLPRWGKELFMERKNLTASEFEKDLESYNRYAKTSGAILFAVYRGKVSEGIDFADKAARAVITIGIPYPNIKEVTIGLKRDYNDIARAQRPNLMPGRDWYASQAFRALNQAFGRCIRHKEDWGAIILIDSRLKNQDSMNNISRWLRNNLTQSDDYNVMIDSLKDFVERRSSEEKLSR